MPGLAAKVAIEAIDRVRGPARRIAAALRGDLAGPLATLRSGLSGIRSAASSVLSPLAAIGAVGAGAGLVALVRDVAEAGDSLAELSQRTGVSAQSLAELRHALGLGGASVEAVDGGVEKLVRSLGQLRGGTGELRSFLGKVSPSLLATLKSTTSVEESIDLLAGALAALPDEERRAALATAAFGRGAFDLIPGLAQGADALRVAREEFRRYHGAITPESLREAEAFADAQARLGLALGGVKHAIGSALLPILTPLLDRLRDWIAANREIVAERIATWIAGVRDAFAGIDWGAVVEGVRGFVGWVRDAVEAVGGLRTVVVILALAQLGPLLTSIALIGTGLVGLIWKIGATTGAWTALGVAGTAIGRNLLYLGELVLWLGRTAIVGAMVAARAAVIGLFRVIMAHPFGALVAAIGLAVAAIVEHWEPIRRFFADLWREVRAAWDMFFSWAFPALDRLARSLERVAALVDVFGILDDEGPTFTGGAGAVALAQRRRARLGPEVGALGTASATPAALGRGEVVVRFEGAPPGTRVEAVSGGAALGVEARVGRRPGATGAW